MKVQENRTQTMKEFDGLRQDYIQKIDLEKERKKHLDAVFDRHFGHRTRQYMEGDYDIQLNKNIEEVIKQKREKNNNISTNCPNCNPKPKPLFFQKKHKKRNNVKNSKILFDLQKKKYPEYFNKLNYGIEIGQKFPKIDGYDLDMNPEIEIKTQQDIYFDSIDKFKTEKRLEIDKIRNKRHQIQSPKKLKVVPLQENILKKLGKREFVNRHSVEQLINGLDKIKQEKPEYFLEGPKKRTRSNQRARKKSRIFRSSAESAILIPKFQNMRTQESPLRGIKEFKNPLKFKEFNNFLCCSHILKKQ